MVPEFLETYLELNGIITDMLVAVTLASELDVECNLLVADMLVAGDPSL